MKIFEVLGIVTVKSIQVDYSGTGRPMNYVEINPEFVELLTYTQDRNNGINSKFQENNPASDDFDSLNPEDFVKNEGKNQDTQETNDGKKDLFHKNKPVRNEKIDFSELKLEAENE
jgi:hypothetical protein